MRSLALNAAAALAAVALAWWLAFQPRIDLQATQLEHALQQLAAAGLLDQQRLATIDQQAEQLAAALENEQRNRALLTEISNQSRAHSAALQELKRNDQTVMDYLHQPVPADLGRLYQRTATADPAAYRQSAQVPIDGLPTSSAQSPASD